jgi:MAF protein
LVLASASPRRQALIGLLELRWRAAPADIDEQLHLLADPLLSVLNVAAAKGRAVAGQHVDTDEIILAADTLVVDDGDVLGKPADADAARLILRRLGGRAHQVLTGVLLRTAAGIEWGGVVSTRVEMRTYAESEIDAYVARGEPLDKAGAYAIQDAQFSPVERIEGCFLNVVGLPVCAVTAGLAALGIDVRTQADRLPPCGYCRAGKALTGG